MRQSHLKDVVNISKKPEDMAIYRAQRNLVVKLNDKAKESYFKETDTK